AAVRTLAAGDADPNVHGKATVLAARNPDPALGNELIAGAIEYAQGRLAGLRDEILGDVAAFAAAAGVPGFADAGDIVAGHLSSARAALDLVATRMASSDFSGAARQIGVTLRAIADAAAATVGGASFLTLLSTKINWAAVVPKGFAQQIGLPASVPS